MKKPNIFFVIGMPRSGTTYLYNSFMLHPEIFVPIIKEICFFSKNNINRGLEWYYKRFDKIKEGQLGCDISPPLFLEKESFENIKSQFPDAKIILSVRDPIEYSISFYHHLRNVGLLGDISFNDYLDGTTFLDFPSGKYPLVFKDNHIFETVLNAADLFRENILIYDFSFFRKNKLAVLKAIERHLGIDNFFNENNIINKKINFTSQKNKTIFHKIMLSHWLRDLIIRHPSKVVSWARHKIDSHFSPSDNLVTESYTNDCEYQTAFDLIGSQSVKIKKYFHDSPIILG